MSNPADFVIENGVLIKYVGHGGDVVIPEGVKEIGYSAFYNCKSLASVTIPDSVTEIGWRAFEGCKKIVIRTPIGSFAETYAKKNKIPFVAE